MAKGVKSATGWYLAEWLDHLGLTQAALVRDLGWPKAKVSDLVTGTQRYHQKIIEDLAASLRIDPHELLLHPQEALALRALRASALEIAEHQQQWQPKPAPLWDTEAR